MADADPANTPALSPPSGLQSNFVDPPTLMPSVIITSTVVLTLMTACVAARAFVKLFIIRKHYIEDWLCYWASAGVVTYTGIHLYIANYGFARHQWDVTLAMYQHILYYINVLYCVYSPTTLPAKLSVLFQIKRIFTTMKRDRFYWVLWASIVANILVYTGLFFSYVFTCWPREAIWDNNVKGKCISPISSNLAAGILNVISDVEALLLPAWGIYHLNMPIERKFAVFAVFGVGAIACVIGMVGIYIRVVLLSEPDFTWTCTKAALLVISEMATVVIVGCCPSMPRLVRYIRGRERENSRTSYETPRSQRYAHKMPTLAKYMGPHTISTLSDEHLQLHRYHNEDCEQGRATSADGTVKSAQVEVTGDKPIG